MLVDMLGSFEYLATVEALPIDDSQTSPHVDVDSEEVTLLADWKHYEVGIHFFIR